MLTLSMHIYPLIMNLLILLLILTPSSNMKIHPLYMMLNLILLAMLLCFKMNFIIKSWISYMLFLSMISGLMIIYMYITSIASNEIFKFNMLNLIINFIKINMISMTMMILLYKFNISPFNSHFSMNIYTINEYISNKSWMSNFYNLNLFSSSTYMILYILFSLICIMNICYSYKSPLRQMKKNYE